ncbi:MAG: hypothetical protein AAB602_01155 [Patescibacteria group bacterium]
MIRQKQPSPPALVVSVDQLIEETATGSFSTMLFVSITGHWPGGRPSIVGLIVRKTDGTEFVNDTIDICRADDGQHRGQRFLTGLESGRHYSYTVDSGGKKETGLIKVEKPKPESEQARMERENREYAAACEAAALASEKEAMASPEALGLKKETLLLSLQKAKSQFEPPKVNPIHIHLGIVEEPLGSHTITVTVLSKNGAGGSVCVPNSALTISIGGKRFSTRTDSNGVAVFTSEVTREEVVKNVTVSVDGTETTEKAKLFGPPSSPKP